jgi:hypothetical protein
MYYDKIKNMSNPYLTEKDFVKVYKYGTFYNPAQTHYITEKKTVIVDDEYLDEILDEIGPVGCDRCNKIDLKCCIGYKDIDLCLECVNDINDQIR